MTNKTKQRQRRKVARPKKATPFADAGAIAGNALGGMFNMPFLKGVGKWLGSGIGQILGSGDYQMIGQQPGYNVLTNDRQIPKFSSGDRTNIVCHREFLGDLSGSTGFFNRSYPLNPGNSKTFPWLSSVAQNYQQYRIHGMIFEFRPLITDFVSGGAPGVVVLATNYNAADTIFKSKVEMENSEYAVSVKPTHNLMHAIECAASETTITKLYVRSGPVPSGQDVRLYDMGVTQFASQGNPTQLLGELWVSYCVEFFKPVLPEDVGVNAYTASINRSGYTNANPLGLIGVNVKGDLALTVTGTGIFFDDVKPGTYAAYVNWVGDTDVAVTCPSVTLGSGLLPYTYIFEPPNATIRTNAGTVASEAYFTQYFTITPSETGVRSMTFGTGTLPTTNTVVSIVVTRVDDLSE